MNPYTRMCLRIATLGSALAVVSCVPTSVSHDGADDKATNVWTGAGIQSAITGDIGGRWYTGDGGESAELPDGREIMVMGDTFSGLVNPDGSRGHWRWATHNAAIVLGRGSVKIYTGAAVGADAQAGFVPMGALHVAGRRDYYWPEQVFMDGAYLRVFVAHVYSTTDGRFHVIGTDLATFAVPRNGDPLLLSVVVTPGSRAGDRTPTWGAAVIQNGRWTYVFGSLNKHDPHVLGFNYYLARVARGDVADPNAWRYWTGTSWETGQLNAAAVVPGTAGIGSTATVILSRGGGFAFIGKKDDVFGTPPDAYLTAWKASSLTGPFVQSPTRLLELTHVRHNEETYLGLAHPEVVLPGGRLLVSWCLTQKPTSLAAYAQSGRFGLKYAEVAWP